MTILKKAVHGAKWMTIGIIAQRLINIITFVTLARILAPEVYGVMIAAMLVVGAINIMFEPGFETVLVQKKEEVNKYLNPAFTFNVFKGFLLFVLMCALSPLITKFFHIEGNELVICASGLFLLMQGFNNVGQLFLFKEIKFGKIFARDMVSQLSYLVVALTWAIISPSVWALVAGNFALYASGTIMTYVIHPYRPKLDLHIKKLRELINKAKWVIGTNMINYFSNIIDTTFLGYLLGPGNMAVYSKARDISIMPSSYINQITMKVGFPAFAKVQDETAKIREGFLKIIDVTLLISLPFLLVVLFEGDRIVPLFLGEKWIDMIGPLKMLTIAMTIKSFINIANPIFYGLGKFDMRFKTTLLQLITTAGFLVYAVPKYGLNGAAYAVIASFVIVFFYAFIKLIPLIKVNLFKTLPSALVVSISAFITILIAYPFEPILQSIHGIVYLAALSLLGLIYLIFVVIFGLGIKAGPYKTILIALKALKK